MSKLRLKLFFLVSVQTFFIVPMATTSSDVVVSSDAKDLVLIGVFYRALDASDLIGVNKLLQSNPWLANLQTRCLRQESPLHRVARKNDSKAMKLLIDHGAHISKDKNGNTPVHIAVENNAYQFIDRDNSCVVQLLKLESAQIHVPNNDGDQPLHIACRRQLILITELLVELGACTDVKNNDGLTPQSIVQRLDTMWKEGLQRILAAKRIIK